MDKSDILDLTPETFDETEPCLCATIVLTLVVDFLRDFLFENLGRLCILQNLILAQREEFFEGILGDGKADNELLPRKEWAV